MAAVSATCVRYGSSFQLRVGGNHQIIGGSSSLVSFGWARPAGGFRCIRTPRLQICAAKAETVQKVSDIVRKQLALAPETEVTPLTKFTDLGADSLDTVEIVMGLEEEFDISVEEENAENITTIQEAADLIDKLVDKK